jgi:hypothetical protein
VLQEAVVNCDIASLVVIMGMMINDYDVGVNPLLRFQVTVSDPSQKERYK